MAGVGRFVVMLGLVASGLAVSELAYAECGGSQQCIAVSTDPLVAPFHGSPLTSSTVNFGNQTIATASAPRTILVAAVQGPNGTLATLNAISLSGPNAAEFQITGGTCTVGVPSLLHDGAVTAQLGNACSITVTFSSATLGPKNASLAVQTTDITRTIPLTGVTVAVGFRPDPSQDANVRGLLAAQTQTAKRFSRAQIVNFQRRMESLHRGSGADSGTASGVPGIAGDAHAEIKALRSAGAGSGLLPASFATSFMNAATTRSLNLSHSSDRAGGSSGLAGTGVWIGGSLNFGTRDETGGANGLRFGTEGISAGVDRRFGERLALGVGVGYARDRTEIGSDGTKSRSSGTSVAVYGSYQPTPDTFVDGLLGYGTLRHRTDRFVASANDFARADRKGDQIFGSLAAGFELRKDGLLLSPYGRVDFSNDRLKQATETGAGLNALTYFEQKSPTLQLALGLRVESRHQTSFGWALPRLRVEFRHDLKDEREARIAYADQFAGPIYSVAPVTAKRDALLVGIGSDFLFRDGLKLGVDYQVQRLSGADRSQAVRLWLAKELDGKSVPTGLQASKLFANPVSVEGAYTWDDNVTRARDAGDQLSDRVYNLNVGQGLVFPLGTHTRLVATGFVNGDKFRTYRGLDRFSAGAQGEFQYRASGEFDAPTFGILGRLTFDDYQSRLRGGHRFALGVTYRQLLTDRIAVFGALARNARFAKNDVFDARDTAARFNLDYSLGQQGTLYLGGEYRRGDTVSTASASPESGAIAKFSVLDDAYGGGAQRFAYRYEAETTLWTLGYNRPLGPRDSIDLSWRHAAATPTARGTYAVPAGPYGPAGAITVGKSRYTANQYSIAYLMRF